VTRPASAFFWIAALLLTYDVLALLSPDFVRRPAQWAAAVGTALAVELLARRLRSGAWESPVAGLISGLGVLLLCDSPYAWTYAAVSAVSLLSKHLLRPGGRHVFNPTNLGMVAGVLFLSEWMTMEPARWAFGPPALAALSCFGAFVAWKGGRLVLSASYLAVFVAGACVRAWLLGVPPAIPLAPVTGAAFHLFAFYMVTDPMTTPSSRAGQFAFGAGTALLDAALRHGEYRFAPLLALLVASALRPAASLLAERLQRSGAAAEASTSTAS
jgi:enediyne biosynthesis protein E5